MTELDHIAVIAPDLATGVSWVREALGVEMPAGGKHPEMGTHNHLVSLGPDVYLEVIAIDPEAPQPPHPRWFGLDDREMVEHEWRQGRRLRAYVARCTDIAAATAGDLGTVFGTPMRISRGDRQWLFAMLPDGELPGFGALPCLIDWGEGGTPAPAMPDLGLRLQRLVVETVATHTNDAALLAIGMTFGPFDIVDGVLAPMVTFRRGSDYRLTATIATPNGVRVLS